MRNVCYRAYATRVRGLSCFIKTCKTLGYMTIIVCKIPPVGGGSKPYLSNGLLLLYLSMRILKALVRLRICAGSSDPSLLVDAISDMISCAGPYFDMEIPISLQKKTRNSGIKA